MESRPGVQPSVYSVKEVAAILRRSENAVRAGVTRGEIPGRRVGKIFFIPARTFDRWLHEFEAPQPARRQGGWS